MTTLYIVSTPELHQTERVSYRFLIDSQAPHNFLCNIWGTVTMRCKADNEINPFRFVRGEPGAIGDDGVKRWDLHLFESGRGNICSGGVDESPPKEEGLQTLLRGAVKGMDRIAVLMEKSLLERFTDVCRTLGIDFHIHDCPEALSTN